MSEVRRKPGLEPSDLADLPGADLVARGLRDVRAGSSTPESLLIEIALSLFRELGFAVPDPMPNEEAAELRLYAKLGERYPERDPYPIYCAWLEQLDSFVHASAQRRRAIEARTRS
jgi:hypothetical protein